MADKDNSQDILLAKLEEKFAQLLEVVNDIKESLNNQMVKLADIDRDIILLKLENDNRRKEVEKLTEKQENTKKWMYGLLTTVIGGVVLAICKQLLNI